MFNPITIKGLIDYKKGRGYLLLPFLLFTVCCSKDLRSYGKVELHNTVDDKRYFTFTVSDEFVNKNKNSPKNKKYPKITEAEFDLLTELMKEKKYCISRGSTPSFAIISRQEKIYDMTFAHLIEENYNARPIAPLSYYGRCKR